MLSKLQNQSENFEPQLTNEFNQPFYKLNRSRRSIEIFQQTMSVMNTNTSFITKNNLNGIIKNINRWSTEAQTAQLDPRLQMVIDTFEKRYRMLPEQPLLVGIFTPLINPELLIAWFRLTLLIYSQSPNKASQVPHVQFVANLIFPSYNQLMGLFIDTYAMDRITKRFDIRRRTGRCNDSPEVVLAMYVAGNTHVGSLHKWLTNDHWTTILHLSSDTRCIFVRPLVFAIEEFFHKQWNLDSE